MMLTRPHSQTHLLNLDIVSASWAFEASPRHEPGLQEPIQHSVRFEPHEAVGQTAGNVRTSSFTNVCAP